MSFPEGKNNNIQYKGMSESELPDRRIGEVLELIPHNSSNRGRIKELLPKIADKNPKRKGIDLLVDWLLS